MRTRTRYISIAKSLVRRDGLRVAGSESHFVAKRIEALELSETLADELLPLITMLAPINEQIAGVRSSARGAVRERSDRGSPGHGAISRTSHRERGSRQLSTTSRDLHLPISSKRSWGWYAASRARVKRAASAGSRRPATHGFGICWSKPDGASCDRSRRRRQHYVTGRDASPCGAGIELLSLHWLVVLPGFSLQCGVTASRTTPRRCVHSDRCWYRQARDERRKGVRVGYRADCIGTASALQPVAAGDSRDLVSADRSIVHPNAPGPVCSSIRARTEG